MRCGEIMGRSRRAECLRVAAQRAVQQRVRAADKRGKVVREAWHVMRRSCAPRR